MNELSEEEQRIVANLNRLHEERKKIPLSAQPPVLRPEKYEDLPGFDSDGNLNVVHEDDDEETQDKTND